jgi:hypothetical protein
MLDINSLASQIKHNCNISDSRYWGFYSPCGLLLRLRNLYKIEKGLSLREKIEKDRVIEWIGEREELWKKISFLDFMPIEVDNRKFRPFDIKGLNTVLCEKELFYGAGYGDFLKPAFLLAEISKKIKIGRYTIYILNRELARDLSSHPAMLQGNTIIARQETMKYFLWDKLEEMRAKKFDDTLSNAFSEYGISKDVIKKLSPDTLEDLVVKISEEELFSCIHHEIGEASQRKFLGRWWKDLVVNLPYGRTELFIRSLKDILADTCTGGMLEYIIKRQKKGSLGFYLVSLGGYRRVIFGDIVTAYNEFIRTGDWEFVEKARKKGYKRVRNYIGKLKVIADAGGITPEIIENKFMKEIERDIPGSIY